LQQPRQEADEKAQDSPAYHGATERLFFPAGIEFGNLTGTDPRFLFWAMMGGFPRLRRGCVMAMKLTRPGRIPNRKRNVLPADGVEPTVEASGRP